MRKLLLALVSTGLVFGVGTAQAVGIYWDVGTAGYGTGDGVTAVFNEVGLAGASLINQNDTNGNLMLNPGDTFTETLIFYVDTLKPPSALADSEGLGSNYEITGVANLSGVVQDVNSISGSTDLLVSYTFDPGKELEFYIDAPDYADPYTAIQLADGTNPSSVDTSAFVDGTLIAKGTVISGAGQTQVPVAGGTPDTDQGSVNLTVQLHDFLDNFWYDSLGRDLLDELPPTYVTLAFPAVDVDLTVTSTASNTTGTLFDAKVSNDGSAPITVVPEPGTMILLGSGLIGVAGAARRRRKKA